MFFLFQTRTTIVVDGNTVTQTTKSDKNVTFYNREFNGDELVGVSISTYY